MSAYDYDLVVIGSDPAGQRAAIQAAKLGIRVLVIERESVVGGICINTGTIPSKTLREAVMHLSGYRERGIYGSSYTVKQHITMPDLHFRTDHVIRHEIDVTRHQLQRNRIELAVGNARFVDPHTVAMEDSTGRGTRNVSAGKIIIAVGTMATRDKNIPFDGQRILISDDILTLKTLPRTMTVVGAGVIGLEYATIFAALGVRVTVIDKRSHLLPFVDREITSHLAHYMQQNRATLRLGEEVSKLEIIDDDKGARVKVVLASGKQIITDKALYSIGRTGATGPLNLPAAGIEADDRGRLKVNENLQTNVPHVYAVGEVIGFPSLASTSMEQGRLAACHAFNTKADCTPSLFPYGIYTIPEISTVGKNEEELTEAGIPYEVGKAHYKEIARGQILGEDAAELIHIGQAVMAHKGAVDYFVNTVFNYPTLAECYKTAAFDGINRLG